MAECAPTHLRSLAMALGLMTNWLFNFVCLASAGILIVCIDIYLCTLTFKQTIAKITPTLLVDIKYGTFLLFGCCSILMVIWAVRFLASCLTA